MNANDSCGFLIRHTRSTSRMSATSAPGATASRSCRPVPPVTLMLVPDLVA